MKCVFRQFEKFDNRDSEIFYPIRDNIIWMDLG